MIALKPARRARRPVAAAVFAGLACLLGLAGTAQAVPVVVDPDSAANLADISNAFAGVTLSAIGATTTDGKVYSLDPTNGGNTCCTPPTGTQRLRVFRSCPFITPKGARSSLQMLAIAGLWLCFAPRSDTFLRAARARSKSSQPLRPLR